MKITRALIQELELPIVLSKEDAISDMEDAMAKCLDEPIVRPQVVRLLRNGLWLLHYLDQELLQEARKSQTKFYFLGDSFGTCFGGDESHFEWIKGLGLASNYPNMTLGHFDPTSLHLYDAVNQPVHKIRLPRIINMCKELLDEVDLDPSVQVYNGTQKLGTLKELLAL